MSIAPQLTLDQSRRLATYAAAASRSLFPIAQSFIDTLAPSFPEIHSMIDLRTASTRASLGWEVSDLIKNIANPAALQPNLGHINATLQAAGASDTTLSNIRAALLNACKCQTPHLWSDQLHSDLNAAFNSLTAHFNLPAHTQQPKAASSNFSAFPRATAPARQAA